MLTPADALFRFVTERTGIELSRGGLRDALATYARRRLADLALSCVEDFIQLLQAPDGRELRRLIDVISVPHTWFFRDPDQLEVIAQLLPALAKESGRLSLWVPGCATGEDAYSLSLMTIALGVDADIVASDLCESSLEFARLATYNAFSLRSLPSHYRSSFQADGSAFRLAEPVRKRVRFVQHNLLDPTLAATGGWHLILCRNVFIYFSFETAQGCASKLGRSLHDAGVALFGAGELITATPQGLAHSVVGNRVVFRRCGTGKACPQLAERPTTDIRTKWIARKRPSPSLLPKTLRSTPGLSIRAGGGRTGVGRISAPTSLLPPAAPSEKDYEEAHANLAVSSQAPLTPELRMLSGIALYSAGDFQRSLHELRAASLLNDRLWPAAIYQGMVLETMGLPDLARAEYRHAVRVLNDSPDFAAMLPTELTWLGPDLVEMARRKSA